MRVSQGASVACSSLALSNHDYNKCACISLAGGQRGMQLSGPLSNGATSIGYTLEGHGHGHGHGQSQMLQFPQIVYSSQGGALVPQV